MKKSGLLCLIAVAPLFADRMSDDIKRIDTSATVLSEIMHAKDGGIPEDLLRKAQCVGIIPNQKKAGFIVGAKYGKGVLTCRTGDNHWSGPDMIVLEGGSFGLQIGAGETDVVFTVMNRSGMDKLMKDKVTIGGDVTAAVGPLGRDVSAMTDAMMHAEILTWSRSRGVFGGISLEGSSLRSDGDDNRGLYGKDVTSREVLTGEVKAPEGVRMLYRDLERYAPKEPRTGY